MTDRSEGAGFDVLEITIADIHAAISAGEITATGLIDRYLSRITAYDERLNSLISINSHARDRASDLDADYEQNGFVGPLHGVPIILKDNYDTHDLPTTAGSVLFADAIPERDAFVVERLRSAGGVIVGKANLQELSFGVDTVSSLGGETRNPYHLEYRPAGSSGGTAAAIAANLGAVGTGSDTCSSVRSPPAFTNLVGLRPTHGLLSRSGIVPLSETQDIPGPITRTVEDAAKVLEAMVGFDRSDPVTARGHQAVPEEGYTASLDTEALADAKVGIVRALFGRQVKSHGTAAGAASITDITDAAVQEMAAAGATIVDPVELMEYSDLENARVIEYEFKRAFDRYLDERPDPPVDSLKELVSSGTIATPVEERIKESAILDIDTDSLETNVDYLQRLVRRDRLKDEVLSCFADLDLDALVYPPTTIPPVKRPASQPFEELNCELAAHTGLPAIVVQAGFTDTGLPVGIELLGHEFGEPRLFELAYSFEQRTKNRRPPEEFGSISGESR